MHDLPVALREPMPAAKIYDFSLQREVNQELARYIACRIPARISRDMSLVVRLLETLFAGCSNDPEARRISGVRVSGLNSKH